MSSTPHPHGGALMSRTIGLAVSGAVAFTLAFFTLSLFSPTVEAIPAFARKTGLACSACHEVWPRLNDFGCSIATRGYKLKRDRDAPVQQDPSYWPLTFRTTAGYQFLRNRWWPRTRARPRRRPGRSASPVSTSGRRHARRQALVRHHLYAGPRRAPASSSPATEPAAISSRRGSASTTSSSKTGSTSASASTRSTCPSTCTARSR